ncbi:hypothetical protein [Flaviaesturariibacter terrae]
MWEFDEEEIFNQAKEYVHGRVSALLTQLVTGFQDYRLTGRELATAATLYQLVSEPDRYEVETGSVAFLVKEELGGGNHRFAEIRFDADGLALQTGGYEMGEFGGDSFSEEIYPVYDEMEALGIMDIYSNFENEFWEMLDAENREIMLDEPGNIREMCDNCE